MAVLKKILFKNKRVGGTPVNAPNLNQVQDNTQEALNTLETDTNKRIENTNGKIEETKINAQNELDKVKSNLINLSAEGEEIQVNDSSDLSAKIDVRGNTKQNGEPTPDYPQEIESVKAYNMVNIPRELKTFNEYYSYPIDIKKGTYTIYTSKIETDGANNFSILFANETGAYQEIIAKKEQQYYTITLNKDYVRMQIYPQTSTANSKGKTTTFYDLMVYEGTEQKPYQKYGEIAVKQTGKNLINEKKFIQSYVPSVSTGKLVAFSTGSCSNLIEVNSNLQYYFKGANKGSILYIFLYDKDKKLVSSYNSPAFNNGIKLNDYPEFKNTKYIRIRNDVRETFTNSILTIENNVDLYEPYQEHSYPIKLGENEMNKIGNAQDYFHRINGKWHLHKETGKYNITGNEDWSNDSGTIGNDYRHNILLSKLNIKAPNETSYTYYSNRFIRTYLNDNKNVFGRFYISKNWLVFTDKNGEINSTTNWKQWLKDNPTEIVYELATPTETEITDPVLINQLNALEKAEMFKPTTILTNNSIAIMKLDYIADTKTYIDNLIKPKEQIQQAIPQTIPENKELEK